MINGAGKLGKVAYLNWLMNFVKRMMKYENQKQLSNYKKTKNEYFVLF